jgi:AraC-like DNA-binding protein
MPERPLEVASAEAFRYYGRLRSVRDHLLRNLAEPLSAERAARVADLSPNYFSTYFRERVGVSFTHWAHEVRIEAACELMRSSDLGVVEVARRVGYRDLRTFERAFKRLTSMSPRAYRSRVRVRGGGILQRRVTDSARRGDC